MGEVASLLADDVVCDWPVSGERTRGRCTFVTVNRADPGDGSVSVRRMVAEGDRVASKVGVTLDDRSTVEVSFDDVRVGETIRDVDYWPKPYPDQTWRAQWVDPLPPAAGASKA